MEKLKKQKGITLIALIITIIVMLILVGASVTVALNGGLFETAKQATNKTQLELDKEQLLELALGAMDKDGNVNSTEITKSGRFTESNGVYTSKSGNKFTVGKWGSVQSVAIVPKKENYTIGEPVTIGDESFYVIEDDAEKVTLLAKDCIDTTTLVQSASAGYVVFSTEKYWEEETDIEEPEATLDEKTGKLTLPASHTAAKAAYDYGRDLGGTGRLMTHKEASDLLEMNNTDIRDILHGQNGKSSSQYGLIYWIGTASFDNYVWLFGSGDGLMPDIGDVNTSNTAESDKYGVRPVVEILKSDI